ncbi:MAG: hypothetical protein ACK4PK_04495 [Alphaproteobacteria bacterium]
MLPAQKFFTVLAAAGIGLFLSAQSARAEYAYIHNDGEYSVTLPDAPSGETIWYDHVGDIPFIEERPKFGSLGEVASMRRTDAITGDSFNIDIIFIKSGRDYLLGLDEKDLRALLEREYANQTIENKKISYSPGTGTLKWGTFTGFSVDRNNNLMFHSCHILTGFETVTMIKIAFNAENEKFGETYQKIKNSIKFVGTK